MKYYIIKRESDLTIMNVEDRLANEFEKEYSDRIIVQAQSTMAEALVKFGEVATQEQVQLGQGISQDLQPQKNKDLQTERNQKLRRKI